MKPVILASLVASAAAFAPAQVGRTSTSVALDISGQLGAQVPLGAFDPLGIMEDATQDKFDTFRECEIVHGRVAMLAVTGYLTTYAGVRFPGAGVSSMTFTSISLVHLLTELVFIMIDIAGCTSWIRSHQVDDVYRRWTYYHPSIRSHHLDCHHDQP